jgi:hypothetical protein
VIKLAGEAEQGNEKTHHDDGECDSQTQEKRIKKWECRRIVFLYSAGSKEKEQADDKCYGHKQTTQHKADKLILEF